jgi:23S rRNA (cytidine2498-2'-O)-methyltransferase
MRFRVETLKTPRAFLAFPDMMNYLAGELIGRFGVSEVLLRSAVCFGDMLFFEDFPEEFHAIRPYWAKTAFISPFFVEFDSIAEAASALRSKGALWAPYFFTCFRRGALIQGKLPYMSVKERPFPYAVPQKNIGCYTLLDEHTLLASAETSSFLPAGGISFIEDHENPPSRAYLKLQEALTILHSRGIPLPSPGTRCFDAGSSPGGWTWLLAELLGADVLSVDRSPLADCLMANPRVKFLKHDAFTLDPKELGAFDWVFSDVACYPARLLEWIQGWQQSALVKHMVCTIKLQGEMDWKLLAEFEACGGEIRHLNYNKHELTWLYAKKGA